jgi:tetratricopeptide (TPR) repeat protein
MARRYFNWKLAIVLVVGLVVLCVTALGLRQWQKENRAERGLVLGNEAYEEHRYEDAARYLGRYVGVYAQNIPALMKYADAQLKIRPHRDNNDQQAIGTYHIVLREDPANSEAAKRLIGLYLEWGMADQAESIAKKHLETARSSEFRRLLAIALAGQRKFDEAAAELKSIVADEPNQVSAYEALGQLAEQLPGQLSDPPEHWYDEAIKSNPSTALAYIARAGFHLRSKNNANALADLEQAEKDNANALADLEKAEKLDLSDTAVRLRLALEFLNAGASDKAEKHLAAVKEMDPTDEGLWRTWAQIAFRTRSQAKMLEVAESGLKSLSSMPWDFMPIAAELFTRGGDPNRATECIDKLSQKDMNPMIVASLRGLVAGEKGNLREAVKYWRQSMALGNKSPQVQLGLASALSALGDTQSALRELRTFVSQWPDSYDGHLALAKLLAKSGDWAAAADHARKAMQLSPQNAEAVLLNAQTRVQLLTDGSTAEDPRAWDDMDKQLTSLEAAADDPLQIRLLRLQLAVQREKFTEAQDLLTQLKKDYPSHFRIAMSEAGLLAAQNKDDEAILMLEKTIKEFPDAAEPVSFLALMSDHKGDRGKCEAVLKEALARIKEPLARRDLSLLLAQFYERWGQADDAYSLLDALSKEEPDSIPAKRRLLSTEGIAKDPQKAQQLVDQIKALEGEGGCQWRYEQARVWFRADDFDKQSPQVVSLLQENLLANPDDQASRVLLADTYERTGRSQMALAAYREALSRSPQDVQLIVRTVAALWNANEFEEAEGILNRISREKLSDPALQRLQFQSHIRGGELGLAADVLKDYLLTDPNNVSISLNLALLKMQQNDFDEASKLLDELRAKDPNSLTIIVAQIQLHVRRGKPQEALKLCDQIIDKYKSALTYVIRARTYISLKAMDKAKEDYDRAVAVDPNNVDVLMARSDFYDVAREPQKATADIERALSLDPNNLEIQRRAASLFLASGGRDNIRQATAVIDRALESDPNNGVLRLLKARALLAEETAPAADSAAKLLEKLTEEYPKMVGPWGLLGEVQLRQGLSGKAIDTVLQGLVHNPNDRSLLMLKARAEAAKSPFLAIATLKELLTLDPNDIGAAMRLADAYIATNEFAKAVSVLRQQLALCDASDRRRCEVALAVALYSGDNKAEAKEIFDSLLQAEPNDPAPILAQVTLFEKEKLWSEIEQKAVDWYRKHPEDAKTPQTIAGIIGAARDNATMKVAENILRMVLKDHSDNAEIVRGLAVLMQAVGRSEEAAEFYRRVLEIQADDVVAMNNLAWIICEEQGKHQEAIEIAQKGLKIAPNYIDLIDTRGVAYYRLGRFDKAIQDFSDCIRLYPDERAAVTAVYFHLGRAYTGLKEADKAAENLKKALSLNEKVGGLSDADLAEATHLLDKLSNEGG